MDVESLLDEGHLEDDVDSCKEFIELCEEYLVGYIDFYNFITIAEPKNIILCLDDRIFIKIIKKLAEEGIVLDVYYDLENLHGLDKEKIKFTKFILASKRLALSPDTTYAKIEGLLREFCFLYYFSRNSIEEKQSFIETFAHMINFSEIKK